MLQIEKTNIPDTLKYGATGTYEIGIVNPTNEEIVGRILNASCSCTQGEFVPNPIPPNGKGNIIVTFKTLKSGMGNNQHKSLVISWRAGGRTYSETIKLIMNVSRN